jgi:hypothetical protein
MKMKEKGIKGSEHETYSIHRMFPLVFTAVTVLVFMIPSFTLLYIARQPAVDYFLDDKSYLVFLIPIVIVLTHWFHVARGPNRYVTSMALIIPSLLLLLLGLLANRGSSMYVQSLFSIDCDIIPVKAHLQLEWESANAFFQKCLHDTAKTTNYSVPYLADNFRIQDCTDYSEAFQAHHGTWSYLQSLEENYACTGFCIPGQQLWATGPHKDSCSVAVSMIFDNFVSTRSFKVTSLMLLVLVLTALFFVFLVPNLNLGL